jgi:hypothetical protein
VQPIDSAESFALQTSQSSPHRLDLIVYHVSAKWSVGASCMPCDTDALVKIKHDGNGVDIVLTRQLYQRGAILRLDIGGVYYH